MIQREASSNAKMHAALSTNEARTLACGRRCAALDTVSVFVGGEWIMIHGQRSGRVGTCSIALRLLLGWQLLQQFVHELLTKAVTGASTRLEDASALARLRTDTIGRYHPIATVIRYTFPFSVCMGNVSPVSSLPRLTAASLCKSNGGV